MEQTGRLLLRSSPSEDVTPEMGLLLGHSLALEYGTVVIGTDFMNSSPMMKNAVIAGLVSSGSDVIDVGTLSGPAMAMAARKGDCGIYVTEYRQYDLISGYILINRDGSLFENEQIRRLERIFGSDREMPDYRNLGTVRNYYAAVDDYNAAIMSKLKGTTGGSVIVNCNCGTATDSAPQILNLIRADVVSLNAQRDTRFISDSLSMKEADTRHMRMLIEANAGSIGISLNRSGTMFRVFDENGEPLSYEQVLALLILYLRPDRIAVPMNISGLVTDAFLGRIDSDLVTPHADSGDAKEVFYFRPDAGELTAVVREHSAEIGYYNGGFIFGDISLTSDAIYASAVLSQISGNNSLSDVIRTLPGYHSEHREYKISCSHDDFIRMMDDEIPGIGPSGVTRDGCWRIEMDSGWFFVSFRDDREDIVDVLAESGDRLFLISLMEVIDGLIGRCANGQ